MDLHKYPRVKDSLTGRKRFDLTGLRFGRWTVLQCTGRVFVNGGSGMTTWRCRCDCGKEKEAVLFAALDTGVSNSCGCIRSEQLQAAATHGRSKTRAYTAWIQMKDRCCSVGRRTWKDYGGRGITVCDRWMNSFENFYADMGDPPWGHSLDRENNNGGYCKENCRWTDTFTQARNRRTNKWFEWKGESRLLTDIACMENVAYCSFRNKIFIMGMSVEEAVRDCQNRGLTYKEKAKGGTPSDALLWF